MAPKTNIAWASTLLHHKKRFKEESVGKWEAFISVSFVWGVDFSTIHLKCKVGGPNYEQFQLHDQSWRLDQIRNNLIWTIIVNHESCQSKFSNQTRHIFLYQTFCIRPRLDIVR